MNGSHLELIIYTRPEDVFSVASCWLITGPPGAKVDFDDKLYDFPFKSNCNINNIHVCVKLLVDTSFSAKLDFVGKVVPVGGYSRQDGRNGKLIVFLLLLQAGRLDLAA